MHERKGVIVSFCLGLVSVNTSYAGFVSTPQNLKYFLSTYSGYFKTKIYRYSGINGIYSVIPAKFSTYSCQI